MTPWTGGLPPAAHERIERQRASGTSGSLLSAPAAAALRSAGLAPVGEVFGCLVMNLGWTGGQCGVYGLGYATTQPNGVFLNAGIAGFTQYRETPVFTSGRNTNRYSGFGPYVKAFEAAWQGALNRMLTEAAALGAEGVVGVTIKRARLEGQIWEFTAAGTAVRSADGSLVSASAHGTRVWSSVLSPEDTAAAILSSLVPRGIVLGLSVATKHEDSLLRSQRLSWGNTEIEGLSAVQQAARGEARSLMSKRAESMGGSDLVVDRSEMHEFETECGGEKDFHAEAFFVGTVLAPGPMHAFRGKDKPGTGRILNVLPLTDPPTRRSRR
ncbi:putative heavy-metal-binding protein [Frondihabitans sp. PhB188]|uniref:heavy metal-binding domain-containing protein n=1 Tax=Frondihabitans sp. PhB188 TaxID=2485200 RepID=UPI000F4700AB|nr:heavy metal-binding domain-containing protein [Frondihabitans sp. PhB188]ROQ36998.1 putative heavy-metal-binding protein [Frondihabitans sp. PhB188]